jgi:hypothetical protein
MNKRLLIIRWCCGTFVLVDAQRCAKSDCDRIIAVDTRKRKLERWRENLEKKIKFI